VPGQLGRPGALLSAFRRESCSAAPARSAERSRLFDRGRLRRLGLFGGTRPLWVACSNDALRRSVAAMEVDLGPLDRRPLGSGPARLASATVDLVAFTTPPR